MKAYSAETSHTTLQKDTFEFIMTDQQTAEPHPHPAQLREAPSDLLADLRAKIDVIDAKLSALIVERLAIADEIGEFSEISLDRPPFALEHPAQHRVDASGEQQLFRGAFPGVPQGVQRLEDALAHRRDLVDEPGNAHRPEVLHHRSTWACSTSGADHPQ